MAAATLHLAIARLFDVDLIAKHGFDCAPSWGERHCRCAAFCIAWMASTRAALSAPSLCGQLPRLAPRERVEHMASHRGFAGLFGCAQPQSSGPQEQAPSAQIVKVPPKKKRSKARANVASATPLTAFGFGAAEDAAMVGHESDLGDVPIEVASGGASASQEGAVGATGAEADVAPTVIVDVAQSQKEDAKVTIAVKAGVRNEHHTSRIAEPWSYRCTRCQYPVVPDKAGVRLVGKQPVRFMCEKCNSRNTTLVRKFGTWPLPSFEVFSPEEQLDFYKKIRDMSAKDVLAELIDSIVKRKKEILRQNFKQEFLPLSAWAARGFDIEQIKRTSTEADEEFHPRLGKLYSVRLQTKEEESVEEQVREEIMRCVRDAKKPRPRRSPSRDRRSRGTSRGHSMSSKHKRRSRSRGRSRSESVVDSWGDNLGESLCDEEDDTYRHDKDDFLMKERERLKERVRAHKKREQQKASQREERKVAKAKEMAARKRKREVSQLCTKVLSKATPLIAKLDAELKSGVDKVPKLALAPATKAKSELERLRKVAEVNICANDLTPQDEKSLGAFDERAQEAMAAHQQVVDFKQTLGQRS